MFDVLCLVAVFQLKHFLADYVLQTPYMLGKFRERDWVEPLALHCQFHGLFTFFIAVVYGWSTNPAAQCVMLAGFDFGVHFLMDCIKASSRMLGRYKALSASEMATAIKESESKSLILASEAQQAIRGNKLFWWSLGLDQMVHHLTDLAIVACLVYWRVS